MRQGRPISFFSQALKRKVLLLSTYEKKLYALISAIQRWKPYLLSRSFVVRTDYHSLKYLLDQKIGIPMQQKWLSKLLGYDFLSEVEISLALVSVSSLDWLKDIKKGIEGDPELQNLISRC